MAVKQEDDHLSSNTAETRLVLGAEERADFMNHKEDAGARYL